MAVVASDTPSAPASMIVRRQARDLVPRARASAPPADRAPPPDLLDVEPSHRLDAARVTQVLTFGFAQGVPDTSWSDLWSKARVPATTWDAAGFAKDLFLSDLVAAVASVTLASGARYTLGRRWVERVLASPPSDRATIDLRRDVLRELEADDARAELEQLYDVLRRVRAALETPPIQHRAHLRRRLDVLTAVRTAVDTAAASFVGARSALGRIPAWAAAVRATPAYGALVDLLTYDDQLALVDLHVRVGADGRVRGLSLDRVRENRASPLAKTPLGRWLARVALFLRGYRFDPEELMARAVDKVFEDLEDAVGTLLQLSGDLEPYLASLAFRDHAEAAGLAVCLPELVDASAGDRRFDALFNPLLLAQERTIVACDVATSRPDALVLLTGPNSGGKTRLLQAIGIAQLLAQGGFYAPAASARVHLTGGMYASLGQEPAADAPEGRLGTELLRVRALFETVPLGGMVLLDELCSGTNPSEGEELFQLVLGLLAELEPQAFVSTHFLGLAAQLERGGSPLPLAFLQVELDQQERPTYRFVRGVARTSLAHKTAQRLGVTRDDLLALLHRAKTAGHRAP